MRILKSLKNKLPKALILLFLICMLIFSDATILGASSGLLLWFHNVVPTLLPFIIISNLIIRLNISGYISKVFHPFLGRLFGISREGCYPIVIGFLSGLPMGAKVSADLVLEKKISKEEGQFLFAMCNNASPMFIIGYISVTQLKLPHIKYALFAIIYGSAILGALLYRSFHKTKVEDNSINSNHSANDSYPISKSKRFSFDLLDSSIMNGFEIVTRIGGYIILFSIIAQIMKEVLPGSGLIKASLMGILEITTGISQISGTNSNLALKIVLIAALSSLGGLSGIAQTKSVLHNSRLSIQIYFFIKLLSAGIALLLALFYVTFFDFRL